MKIILAKYIQFFVAVFEFLMVWLMAVIVIFSVDWSKVEHWE